MFLELFGEFASLKSDGLAGEGVFRQRMSVQW